MIGGQWTERPGGFQKPLPFSADYTTDLLTMKYEHFIFLLLFLCIYFLMESSRLTSCLFTNSLYTHTHTQTEYMFVADCQCVKTEHLLVYILFLFREINKSATNVD